MQKSCIQFVELNSSDIYRETWIWTQCLCWKSRLKSYTADTSNFDTVGGLIREKRVSSLYTYKEKDTFIIF